MSETIPVINHVHSADVVRVIDGDTFIARVELDFRVKIDITVRVRAVNAPELSTPEGVLARSHLEKVLFDAHWSVVLVSYKDQMSFARWVCDVWLSDGTSFSDIVPRLLPPPPPPENTWIRKGVG